MTIPVLIWRSNTWIIRYDQVGLAVNGVSATDGVKHLTTWMKAQRDANAGASASGLNQYLETHLNGAHGYGVVVPIPVVKLLMISLQILKLQAARRM